MLVKNYILVLSFMKIFNIQWINNIIKRKKYIYTFYIYIIFAVISHFVSCTVFKSLKYVAVSISRSQDNIEKQ